VLADWSRGGRCAAAIAVRPDAVDGWRPMGVACLGAGYTSRTPFGTPAEDLADGIAPVPFWLGHGTGDQVVPVAQSRDWGVLLGQRGWPVRLAEPRTDHVGVIGIEYDQRLRRVFAGTSAPVVAAETVRAAHRRAAKAGRPRPTGASWS
jgi:hypothetical protein